MGDKILIVSCCKEKMHELEFVMPIKKIVGNADIVGFRDLPRKNLTSYSHIILSGTSLHDMVYIKNLSKFSCLKNYEGKILGICSGFQILGLLFGGKLKKSVEIGYFFENFKESFLGMEGLNEVYHLHKNSINLGKDFKIFSKNSRGDAQAVKHKEKEFYGTLFHPEVRNKRIIEEFLNGD